MTQYFAGVQKERRRNRKGSETMAEMLITKETEEKRLKDFQKIVENWDSIPEYAKGKLDGTISTIAAFCKCNAVTEKTG